MLIESAERVRRGGAAEGRGNGRGQLFVHLRASGACAYTRDAVRLGSTLRRAELYLIEFPRRSSTTPATTAAGAWRHIILLTAATTTPPRPAGGAAAETAAAARPARLLFDVTESARAAGEAAGGGAKTVGGRAGVLQRSVRSVPSVPGRGTERGGLVGPVLRAFRVLATSVTAL